LLLKRLSRYLHRTRAEQAGHLAICWNVRAQTYQGKESSVNDDLSALDRFIVAAIGRAPLDGVAKASHGLSRHYRAARGLIAINDTGSDRCSRGRLHLVIRNCFSMVFIRA
jgi:hypothetical protein